MLVSFDKPASLLVTYWLMPATRHTLPLLRVRVFSSATPVMRRRNTLFERRRCKASSNMFEVLSFSIELLRAIYKRVST